MNALVARRIIFQNDRIAEHLTEWRPFLPFYWFNGALRTIFYDVPVIITSCSSVPLAHMPMQLSASAQVPEVYCDCKVPRCACCFLFSSRCNLMSTIVATNFDLHQRRHLVASSLLNKYLPLLLLDSEFLERAKTVESTAFR